MWCRWHYNASMGTIATETLRSPSGSPYCLTADVDGTSVYAGYCASLERLHDAQQGWTIAFDATIRPTVAQWTRSLASVGGAALGPLCLTTGNPDAPTPSTAVFLAVRAGADVHTTLSVGWLLAGCVVAEQLPGEWVLVSFLWFACVGRERSCGQVSPHAPFVCAPGTCFC